MKRFKTISLFILIIFLTGFDLNAEGQWKELNLKSDMSMWASSELVETYKKGKKVYSVKYLFDNKINTCWAEGKDGNGIGETITIVVNKWINRIGIVNGLAKNKKIFTKNNRVRKVGVSLFIAFTAPGLVSELDYYLYFMKSSKKISISLKDSRKLQFHDLPFSINEQKKFKNQVLNEFIKNKPNFFKEIERKLGSRKNKNGHELVEYNNNLFSAYSIYGIVLEIKDVYQGARYKDTCISEVKIETD